MFKEKIIFLDIDGVLNDHSALNLYDESSTKTECIKELNHILLSTFAQIVIISNWAQQLSLERLQEVLTERGVLLNRIKDSIKPTEVNGKNGLVYFTIQKDEFIAKYIKDNNIENYIIIDDNLHSSLLDESKIVKPNTFVGLTNKESEKAIEILLNK